MVTRCPIAHYWVRCGSDYIRYTGSALGSGYTAMIGFVNFDEFYSMVRAFRILWLRGRFGGGKTSLAVILAARMLADGIVDRVVSNLQLTFGAEPVVPLQKSCILLDESWIYLDTRAAVVDYAAFVRKLDHYLLLPSVYPPHTRLTTLYVERIFNGYSLGIPGWLYRWTLAVKGQQETGWFGVLRPSGIFGAYDNKYIPVSDGGISVAIKTTMNAFGYYGKDAAEDDQSEEIIGEMQEAVQAVEDGIVAFKHIADGARKNRKR